MDYLLTAGLAYGWAIFYVGRDSPFFPGEYCKNKFFNGCNLPLCLSFRYIGPITALLFGMDRPGGVYRPMDPPVCASSVAKKRYQCISMIHFNMIGNQYEVYSGP